ncbi:DUF4360 domain-containing protein [Kutzneria viridogrisea]|uniref:Secreted protein n=2 Tax=Kutzneria TaxID=43356 RepID=W5W7V9_9PSEU|nr:DUF4360 domain-containing protein [Kutzneria albida]AHH96815.1 secreted protein [Kutzneria albida DSM 43870]MBA8927964.1 hypothetical protein [Kutzneria viridogrisea]
MLNTIAATGMALSLLLSPAIPQAPTPPPDKITVDVVTVNGSGCPAGTAAVAVASDNTAFTVTYSDYLAKVGPDAGPTDYRKNCQLALRIHYPQGFTYAINQADYRGFASLASGATGLERANYYFQGMSATARSSHPFNGPFQDDWQATDRADSSSLVFAPCGEDRLLNVNTELRVSAGSSSGSNTSFMSMDSTDGSIHTTYHFSWKQCP